MLEDTNSLDAAQLMQVIISNPCTWEYINDAASFATYNPNSQVEHSVSLKHYNSGIIYKINDVAYHGRVG